MAEKPEDIIERLVAAAKQRFEDIENEKFAHNPRALLETVYEVVASEGPEDWILILFHYCQSATRFRYYFPPRHGAERAGDRLLHQAADIIMGTIMADRAWIHDKITSYDGTMNLDGTYSVPVVI